MEPGLEALDASLPGSLPVFPGLAIAGCYVLTDQAPLNRGDGLKAIGLPGGRVALIVGDVVGHGAAATTAMSRLMAILRGQLEDGSSAVDALAAADRYAASAPTAGGATVAIAVIGLADRRVEYAGAGHPAPLHTGGPHGTESVGLAPSRPLGTGGTVASATGHLQRGDLLVLHTDGLLTASAGGVEDGRRQLAGVLDEFVADSSPPRPEPANPIVRGDDLCETILRSMPSRPGYVDDVSLMVVEVVDQPEPFRTSRPATSADATQLCREFESWLREIGAGLLDHMALRHAFGEVVSNVVDHAYRGSPLGMAGWVHIDATLDDEGVLCVCIRDDGRWRPRTQTVGRGLVVAGGLVDSMGLNRTSAGTEVLLRQRLGRAIPVLRATRAGTPGAAGAPTEYRPMVLRTAAGRLAVAGAVIEPAAEEFQTRIHEVTQAGTLDATIDLDEVTHLASAPLRILFDYTDRSTASGATLTLIASPGTVAHQLLDLVDLTHRAG